MRRKAPRVLDASAMIALFRGYPPLQALLDEAEHGALSILLPTAAIADAERELNAGPGGWEPILLTPGVRSLSLSEHAPSKSGRGPATWTRGTPRTRRGRCGPPC